MEPSPSPEPSTEPSTARPVDASSAGLLLDIADRSIVDGLSGRAPALPDPARLPAELRDTVGSFVTLHVRGELNGCIGSIEGAEPLGREVARHAWSSAFDDPRLPPLHPTEYEHLSIEISILSPLVVVVAGSRAALIDLLRPGTDGLLIEVGRRRAVFLPAVWSSLPTPERFVSQLFAKAGLDGGYWGVDVRAWRFTAHRIDGGPARPATER